MPLGIAIDGDGNVYVADSFNHWVQKFTSTGAFITKWGAHGSGNGQFIAPQGIAVDEDGDVYVVDLGNSRVQKFTANGTFISKWGREGTTNGRFSTPNGVVAAPNGDVYITDVNNHRVQRFGYRGRPDGRIRRGTGVLVGNNIYNTTGNRQTRTGSAVRGRSVTYYVSVQNDAVFAERLRLTAGRSTNRFTVRYHSPTGANITRQVTAGSFRTPVLAPQRTYQVRVVVTVLRSAPRNSSLARTLTVRSTTHTTIRDTVKFVTRRA